MASIVFGAKWNCTCAIWFNEKETAEEMPIGLILCAEGNKEQIEFLQLDQSGIKLAEYLKELPSISLSKMSC